MRTAFFCVLATICIIMRCDHSHPDTAAVSAFDDMTVKELFESAGSDYENKEYDKAIEKYNALIGRGPIYVNALYNLGNAYLMKNDLGHAVLNYEKALLISPLDSAININLRQARSKMKQQDPPGKDLLSFGIIKRISDSFTLGQLTVAWFGVYLFLIIFLVIRPIISLKPLSKPFIMPVILLLILSVIPIAHKIRFMSSGAVITGKIVDVRFEPESSSEINFPLYEGMNVFILRDSGEWTKIKRTDGRIGWIKKASQKKIW